MKSISQTLHQLLGDRWEVRKTIWPYPEGYGVYNPAKHTLLDVFHGYTEISRQRAQEECDKLNGPDINSLHKFNESHPRQNC